MSDVERHRMHRRGFSSARPAEQAPTPPAGPGVPDPAPAATPPAPARNMADIAKLFLDGARPAPGNPVRRSPPQTPAPPSTSASFPTTPPAQSRAQRPLVIPAESRRPAEMPKPARPASPSHDANVFLALGLSQRDPEGWRLLSAVAAGIADEQSTTVALAGIHNHTLQIDLFGLEPEESLPPIGSSQAPADFQLARALYTLRDTVGVWLIAAPDPESEAFGSLARTMPHWLLACPTSNDGLVAAYQHLKRAWVFSGRQHAGEGPPAPVPAAFLIAGDYAHAAIVHNRLRTAAHEFLKTDLPLAGVARPLARAPETSEGGTRLLALPVDSREKGAVAMIWSTLVDELCAPPAEREELPPERTPVEEPRPAVLEKPRSTAPRDIEEALDDLESNAQEVVRGSAAATHAMLDHLAQVLDPEEREALAAGFDEEEPPAAPAGVPVPAATPRAFDIRTQVAAPARAIAPAPPAPPVAPQAVQAKAIVPPAPVPEPLIQAEEPATARAGVTLRAFDVADPREADRASQWQSVERSIRDLVPESILLEARPPMSWATESCIAIDPDGVLHIWTLYKDGATWYALREWASEHRNLLALTRRDLVLSRDADVVVHIVLPLEPHADKSAPEKTPSVINTILRTPAKNIHIYRLRVLQWNARRGLIVVPIS